MPQLVLATPEEATRSLFVRHDLVGLLPQLVLQAVRYSTVQYMDRMAMIVDPTKTKAAATAPLCDARRAIFFFCLKAKTRPKLNYNLNP